MKGRLPNLEEERRIRSVSLVMENVSTSLPVLNFVTEAVEEH